MARMSLSSAARWVAVAAVVTWFAVGTIGIRYRRIIITEPLHQPRRVAAVEGRRVIFEDGEVIAIEQNDGRDLRDQIAQSNFLVDVEGASDETVCIFANQDGWTCGFSFNRPICIPLIPVTVYQNRREPIAFGRFESARHRPPAGGRQSGPLPGDVASP